MIKKYLLGLGIVVLGFLGFSNATFQSFIIGNDKFSSNWNNQYDIGFLNKGRFLTNYLGFGKPLVGLDNQYLIFWNDGLYLYNNKYNSIQSTIQGYFQYYKSCDEITFDMTGDSLQNCSSVQQFVYNNDETLNNFISSLVAGDFVFIDESNSQKSCGTYCSYYRYNINVCFSSSIIGKTMCFVGDKSTNVSPNYGDKTPFINSLGFDDGVNFSNISSSYLQNPPGFDYGVVPDGDLTNVSCPTIQQLINNYNSKGFNSGLCYSSDKIFNGSSFVSIEPQSIFDLFNSKEDYLTAFQGFGTYCESSVYNSSVCADYFSGQELRFNIISKLPKDLDVVGGRKQLYTYCNLYNYDPNATTCVSSGVTAEVGTEITNQDVVHSLSNGQYTIVSPVTNNTEYNTVFNYGSGYEYSGDIITNIQQLFGKFTSLFRQQTGNSLGILPLWIIIPFIIIVLFKLFKR